MRRPSLTRQFMAHAVLIIVTIMVLYPVLWVLGMALSPSQAFSLGPNPIPTSITLDHFKAVTATTTSDGSWLFGRQLLNSLVVAGVTSILGISLATTAGYAMSRWSFPGREAGLQAFLVTQMFPGVVMAIPLYILLDEFALLDSLMGLSLVYATTAIPFCTWNMKGYFDTIPIELEEAARMDGASRWTIFWTIVLPLARPALVVTGLFSFMTAWNEFILAATFMNEETAFTLPVVLQSYVGNYGTEWGHFAAGAVVVSLPVMLLFFALQKHLVAGLTAGSVKG